MLHGGDRESLNMRGAILHVLGDLLGSVAAIVAALVILATGWTPIDPILSVLVAVLILFRSAWSLMREAGHLLLEGVPASLDRDGIARDIEANVAGVREVHHMHVWSLDGAKNMATLHACLAEGADAARGGRGRSSSGLPNGTASSMRRSSRNSAPARMRAPNTVITRHPKAFKGGTWQAG